jgi:Carboxypeptidase regulatory-like domain/TonB-dependent Receptor Plug Domain
VQLVAADNPARFGRTAISDSLGRYTLSDVPDGRYLIGFFHPVLDSLGIEPPLRELSVDGNQPLRIDIGIPSPGRLRAAICGAQSATDNGAVVIGVVRDARDGTPAAQVTVTGEWLEMAVTRGEVAGHTPRLVTTTWESGWFAICDVPRSGTMFLLASRGADSTDLIEVQVPASGFLRRDLYLGPSRLPAREDTAQRLGNLASRPRVVHRGDGHLSGSVVNADGWPLADALVRITDGPETRTNDQGDWTLGNTPVGTRMLEVRALGYYPDRRRVDIVSDGQPVHVTLSTLEAVLDTVRIMSNRLKQDDSGFNDRRRKGVGHFMTPKDIARRQPIAVSDLFRSMPGILLEGGVEKRIKMRGAFGKCDPAIYINGMPMTSQRANGGVVTVAVDDIDGWMRPRDVTGIEIYAGDSAPVEYQQGMSGCGSILIWMKLRH